ncbi:MAG: glycerol-3-phosphate dehydrogenase/oxidase [Lentimicrobiaceae bacterium]|nr:glycerol-3-phosphate dehydrogenase/oxidase [Lentimicrobiaceae bacterium]
MERNRMIELMKNQTDGYDFIIIGGGATGIGIALETISRGYKTLLVEKSDFTKSTSSKSTKLVHGGVRYLAQGDIALVREACVERGRLLKNAPHLVKNQSFIIPTSGLFDELMYTVGLTFYDLLAGKYSLGRSLHISKRRTLQRIPTLNPKKLSAGVIYHDGQFDDSRLAVNVLQTAAALGAHLMNYMEVEALTKDDAGKINGVRLHDVESNENYLIKGRAVINATGVFADEVMQMDKPEMKKIIRPSQGVHIVLDKSFLPGNDAIMIPKTDDGRVLFAVPWHNKVVVGTTDTPLNEASLEPVALEDEINFILNTTGRYLTKAPARKDVLSIFAGLRPLAAPKGDSKKTKEISRSHKIYISDSHLFTMIGGKWTTFRRMAEDMVKKVEEVKSWKRTHSKTRTMKIHGYMKKIDLTDPLYFYGTDREMLINLGKNEPGISGVISEKLGLYKAQVIWAVRNEMARSVEDVLSRRTRCLLLDSRESVAIAPVVAELMAIELQKDTAWVNSQVQSFKEVAANYMLN